MRVAIAEDSVLLREGSRGCSARPASTSSPSARTRDELRLKVRQLPVDVAIVDIRLPPTHSDEGLRRRARDHVPATRRSGVLVLSQYMELGLAMKLLADSAEGVGYLLKDRIADVKEFVAAVRASRSGRLGDRPDHRLDPAGATAAATTRSPL